MASLESDFNKHYQEDMQEWYDEMALDEIDAYERDLAHQQYFDEQHELALKEDENGIHRNT